MKQQTLVFMTLCIVSFTCLGNEFPSVITEECSTNEKIFHATEIQTALESRELKREAILQALGTSSSETSFATKQFKGQWFYEYEKENVVFTGFTVRSHYLKVAVITNTDSVATIICDSKNMKQKENSIHRKSPTWKDQLDLKIRIELGNVSRKDSNVIRDININQLKGLASNGFVTDEEFQTIKKRIESK